MQLIIFGGGRWAQEICKEAIKFKNLTKIVIVTNNKDAKSKFDILNKKIIFCRYFSSNILMKKSKFIICNNVLDHFKVLRKIIKLKNDILIEKPLFNNIKHLKILKLKKNIFFSRIFAFDYYLNLFSNRINKNTFPKVNIDWYDSKNEKRYNQIKKHDLKINYNLDVFSHLMNLVEIITRKKIQKIDDYKVKKDQKDESVFSIKCNQTLFEFKISRIKKNRKRYIKVHDLKKNIHEIDFSKNNIILKKNSNHLITKYSYKSMGNLSKMIETFLYMKKDIEKLDINYGIKYLKFHNMIFDKK